MVRARRLLIGFVTLVSLLLPQAVLADGMILPLEADIGYLVVRYHHVTVDVADTHATTHVEQAFTNPFPYEMTTQYIFPVPPGAMVTSFRVEVDGEAQTVNRQDVAATNAALYALVAERHDPSLLQYADWTSLTFDLTLPAGATRTMSLTYDEVLTPGMGWRTIYVLGTERYTSEPLEDVSIKVHLSLV